MRRPLIGIATAVALGTWPGLTVDAGYVVWGGAAAFAAFSIVLHLLHRGRTADVTLYILIVLLTWGFAAGSGRQKIDALMQRQGWDHGCLAVVEGRIASDITDADFIGGRSMVRFTMRVKSVRVGEVQYEVNDALQVQMYGVPRYPPVYGESWSIKGRLSKLGYGSKLGRHRYRLKTGLRNSHYIGRSGSVLWVWGQRARKQTADMLTKGIEKYSDVTGVIHAMLLGYRSHLPDDIRESFRHTGTMHIFAISGLHVGILCTIIVFALSVLGVPRPMWVLVLAPLVGGYAVVTGARASAIRAGIMAVAYLLAPLLKRKSDAVSAFAFAAAVILLWNPDQLTDVGFIYSFAVVAGIMAIVPLFDRVIVSLWRDDEFDVAETGEGVPWHQSAMLWTVRMFSVSLAAWLTSTPLSLYFFGRFSPVALLGNLIAVPLAFLILLAGCLSVLTGTMIGFLGEIFNCANWGFVTLLISGMRMLEKIPYGWIECGRIPLWGVFIWYAVLIGVIIFIKRKTGRGDIDRADGSSVDI